MNKSNFFTFLLISSALFSAAANDNSKLCTDLFANNTYKIVQFPVPPGEFQVREFGDGYFGVLLGSSPLPAGSIFEVRTKKDVRLPERDSRVLLLTRLDTEQSNNLNTGRWIVVKSGYRNPSLKEVYTSQAELNYILSSVLLPGDFRQQFNPTDLRFLGLMLKSSFEIDITIAKEIAENYGQLTNSTNLFTLRQFPRIIIEVLKKYGKILVILDENGHPI